ncbi:major facilitator superfamily domain-containing protein [Mycotypha africana]|uniref:major facilitator superfamily domain-containing protein n=1 Tax=Mycotypha africana TaxID=64632 RepID=UPI0023017270|nr:major facilitator superfamily domain-containing protein [Mycotypha africana]KAI8971622.1 major facilitator superfamily domain-containing protein [Mycotypha africana]
MSMTANENSVATENSITPNEKTNIKVDTTILKDEIEASVDMVSEECSEDAIDFSEKQQQFKLSDVRFIILFTGLLLGFFMATLDTTIIITAAGIIASEFNAVDQIGWIGSAYLLTLSGFQPVYCSITEIIGQRISYSCCILIFIFGSVLCGVSNSMMMLIISRAVQGIGAAGLFTSVLIIICELMDSRTRAIYQGILGLAIGMATLIGPLLGGFLADRGQWRWAFYVNIFVGAVIITLTLVFCKLPLTKKQKERINGEKTIWKQLTEVDYASLVLLMPGAVSLLAGLQLGGERLSFTDPAVVALLTLGPALIILFVVTEVFLIRFPIFPRHFVMSRSNIAILACQFTGGMMNNAIMYFVPLHFQIVKNDNAVQSACKLLPFFVTAVVSGLLSGLIVQKTGYYRFLLWLGAAFCIVGSSLLQTSNLATPEYLLFIYLGLFGLGLGSIKNITTVAGQAGIAKEDLTIATAHGQFMRIFGGAFGVNIAAVLFRYDTTTQLEHLKKVTRSDFNLSSIPALKSLHYMLRQRVEKICLEALDKVYLLVAIVSGIAFISTLLIKEYYIIVDSKTRTGDKSNVKEEEIKKV